MEISKVHAVFFSPTGNAKKVICTVADAVGTALGVPVAYDDFTLPQARQETRSYGPGDLVIFGTPTYAGRIPNKLLPFVQSGFQGNGALAVPVAVFGNRSYDNALMELRNELEAIAAGGPRLPHRGRSGRPHRARVQRQAGPRPSQCGRPGGAGRVRAQDRGKSGPAGGHSHTHRREG